MHVDGDGLPSSSLNPQTRAHPVLHVELAAARTPLMRCLPRPCRTPHFQGAHLVLLVEVPAARAQLVGREDLRLVPRHGVEHVEQRLLGKLAQLLRAQPRRVATVVRRHLRSVAQRAWGPTGKCRLLPRRASSRSGLLSARQPSRALCACTCAAGCSVSTCRAWPTVSLLAGASDGRPMQLRHRGAAQVGPAPGGAARQAHGAAHWCSDGGRENIRKGGAGLEGCPGFDQPMGPGEAELGGSASMPSRCSPRLVRPQGCWGFNVLAGRASS